jgi:trehalose 6-phosphate synthase
MPRMAQFILMLIVGLALLTWAATNVVQTTAREWFERDVSSRAELVLIAASQSLANSWYVDPAEIQKQLTDLARADRVIGAAACNVDLTSRFSTPGFPEEFGCAAVGRRVRTADAAGGDMGRLQQWNNASTLPTGRVQVSAQPITDQDQDIGFLILVHDLSFIDRREAQARTFLFIASGFLALMAFGVPMFVAKWARFGWSSELRSLLRGVGKHNREFQPILSDLRELVGRMANDREDSPGLWTAETNAEQASPWRKDRYSGEP